MKSVPLAIAILLGISIPALILGRSVFAVAVGISLILILIDLPFETLRKDFRALWFHPIGLCLLAVFLLSLPSLYFSDYSGRSFQALGRTFVFCCMGIAVWSYFRAKPELTELLLKSFILSAALSVAFSFVSQYLFPQPYWFVHLKGWKSEHLNHTLKGFSAIVVFVVPLLCLATTGFQKPLKTVALLTACSFVFLVLVLENRASIAGMLALIVGAGFLASIRNRSKLYICVSAGLIISILTGTMIWLRITRGRMIGAAPDGNYFLPVWLVDFERQTIWNHAFDIGQRTPWFGRGPNTINFAPGADKYLEGTQGLNVIPAHPHNWVVELFAEIGAIGLAALVVFLLIAAVRLFQGYRRTGDPKYIAAVAISAGYWGSGLFNFSFWAAWWQLAFILAIALALSVPWPRFKPGN